MTRSGTIALQASISGPVNLAGLLLRAKGDRVAMERPCRCDRCRHGEWRRRPPRRPRPRRSSALIVWR